MVNWADFIKHLRRLVWQHSQPGYYHLVEADYSGTFCLISDGQVDSLAMAEIGLDLENHYGIELPWDRHDFPARIDALFELINTKKAAV